MARSSAGEKRDDEVRALSGGFVYVRWLPHQKFVHVKSSSRSSVQWTSIPHPHSPLHTSTILPTRIVRKMALPALSGVEAAKRLAAYAAVDRHVLKGSKVRQVEARHRQLRQASRAVQPVPACVRLACSHRYNQSGCGKVERPSQLLLRNTADVQLIGIGSGSTVPYVVDRIVQQGVEANKDRLFFPTGESLFLEICGPSCRLRSLRPAASCQTVALSRRSADIQASSPSSSSSTPVCSSVTSTSTPASMSALTVPTSECAALA